RVANVNPRFEDPHAAMARSMAAWHLGYVKWSQPLKVAYTPVQQAGTTNPWTGADAVACNRLAEATAGVIDREELFAAPDPRVPRTLHEAMETLHQLGIACGHGDVSSARSAQSRANSLLTQLAKIYAEYGLAL